MGFAVLLAPVEFHLGLSKLFSIPFLLSRQVMKSPFFNCTSKGESESENIDNSTPHRLEVVSSCAELAKVFYNL